MSNYLKLAIGAPRRLAILRTCAEQNTRAASMDGKPARIYATWREARQTTFRTLDTGLAQGFNSDGSSRVPVWYTHSDGLHFRSERKAHNLVQMRHTGWFIDSDCNDTITGIVAGLTHGRFIAGYECSENGERVYFGTLYDDESDAARAADDCARIQAEKEKEHNDRDTEARDLRDEVEKLECDVMELFAMRHHARARRELAQAVESLRTKRATLENDYADIEI